MRLQLALNVRDIEEAVSYYSKLFGVEPHKRRPGYANYAIQSPPLKLALFENPLASERLHHVGVELLDPDAMPIQAGRLEAAGILDEIENETTCCHATQDKLWSREPQGLRWEWYRITDDLPAASEDTLGRTCCVDGDNDART